MILLIDNYDSFVHNLARYVRELGGDALVRRNDAVTLGEIEALAPSHIIVSPGPCGPFEAGVSNDVIRHFGPRVPILGVCLGHQCIGAVYGAEIVRAERAVHGRTSLVTHDGSSIFAGLPSPLRATRYHSLVVSRASVPASLRIIASLEPETTATGAARGGDVMALVHRSHPVVGVQFHPESVATEHGYAMLDRFLHGEATTGRQIPTRADGAGSHTSPWGLGADADPAAPHPPVELVR